MSVSGRSFKRRVFNMADEDTERRGTSIFRKIVRQWNKNGKADNAAVCVAICSGRTGDENGQVSSLSLAGPNSRMLHTLI